MAATRYPSTLAELITEIGREFPRFNPEAQAMVEANVESWVNDLCDFPFWFLVNRPNLQFMTGFPVTLASLTPLAGNWVSNGWLRTSLGVNRYQVYMPLEDNYAGSSLWYAPARVKNIQFCKEFNENGRFMYDLSFSSPDWSLTNYSYTTPGSTNRPVGCWLEQTETGSYLVLHPVPLTEQRLYAVQFELSTCPWYASVSSPADIKNRFMNYAPQAVLYKCLLHVAQYYDEKGMAKNFERILYGDPPRGEAKSNYPYKGIMGKLVEETREMHKQLNKSIPYYPSLSSAYGRSPNMNFRGGYPGSGYYRFWP